MIQVYAMSSQMKEIGNSEQEIHVQIEKKKLGISPPHINASRKHGKISSSCRRNKLNDSCEVSFGCWISLTEIDLETNLEMLRSGLREKHTKHTKVYRSVLF